MRDGARTAIDRDLDRVLKHLELTVTRRLDGLLRGSFASASTRCRRQSSAKPHTSPEVR